jgi:Gram-negative porin
MRHPIAPLFLAFCFLSPALSYAQPPAAPVAAPPPAAPAAPAAPEPSPVTTKWKGTLYGWLQADSLYDTTQSFADGSGGALIARPGTYAGENGRVTFSFRNSRVGFRLSAPEVMGLRASGLVEFDFNGNQPPGITETAFWSNPTMRGRQAWIKAESDYIDVLLGQTWNLFGWQPFFHPNTLQLQGIPGQVFSRSQQFRLSHTFKTEPVNIDVAVAAARPPQRDGGVPDLHGGLKLGLNGWKGQHVGGAGAAAAADPLSLGVSGLTRQFNVIEFSATPGTDGNTESGWGVSLDALLPVIPASSLSSIGALSLQGSFQTGSGFNDQYTATTGGSTFPAFPAPAMGAAPTANLDAGLATYDAAGNLHTIDWNMFVVDLQYFLPPAGNVWVSANFSQMESGNILDFGAAPGSVFTKEQWWDVNLFWNVTPALRLGAEYASFKQTMGDDTTRENMRFQFSGFYLF